MLFSFALLCPRSETDITTAFEAVIGGSNPSEDAKIKSRTRSSAVELLPLKEKVEGSNPSGCTIEKMKLI